MALSLNPKANPNSDGSSVNKTQSKAIKNSGKKEEEKSDSEASNPNPSKTTFSDSSNFNSKKLFNDFLNNQTNQAAFPASSSTASNSAPNTPWLGGGASNPSLPSNNSDSRNFGTRLSENQTHGGGRNHDVPELPKLPRKTTGQEDPLVPNPDNVKLTQTEFDVIRYTNALRQAAGKDPLIVKEDLIKTARLSSERMDAQSDMNHGKAPGSWTRENIAAGQNSAEEVMNSWKNSKGHYDNLMSDDIKYIGVGDTKEADGSVYWTQQFSM